MKKFLFLASAAIVALASCTQEQVTSKPAVDEVVVLTFTSDRPQLDDPSQSTKTEWSTNKIVWSTGDKIRVGYKKDGSWMGQSAPGTAKFYKSDAVSIDGGNASKGTFSVPISGSAFTDPAVSGTYQFFAVCPGDAISGTDVADPTAKNITIPSTQTPGSNTFDPTADILVGQTEGLSISGLPTDPIELSWTRLVAHADLTFSNLEFSGVESVNKITLTFNTEAKVAGAFAVNIPAATAGEGSTNTLVLSGSNITSGADYAEAWACVLPVTFTSLNVEVKTDKAIYTRNITGISKAFKQNARNTLTINMSTATRTPITELVADGNYVIAVLNSTTYYAISSDANGTRRARVEITTDGFDPDDYSEVSPYTAANKLVWTVTNVSGGIKINQATDPSSYMAYTSNGINLNSTGSVITVEEGSSTGTYNLYSTSYMWMNQAYGFGFYANDQTTKDFYFIPATGTPTLTFPVTSKNVSAETTSVEFSYTSLFLAGNPNVSVTSDTGSAVADTDIADGTLTVTLNENTTASDKSVTLTVSAAGVSNVVLTITQAGVIGDASNGDTLWAEAFSGFSDAAVPAAGNASTTVYGSKSVTYTCVDGGSITKVYGNDNLAGGVKPELLVSKTNGSFTVSGIPTGNATGMTLSFKANNGNIVVSSSTPSATVGSNIGTTNAPVYGITVPGGTKTLSLTFSNAESGNTRIDDLLVVAGAPVAGITVATSAASATATAAGTTATLNGSLTLVNGAVNSSVTSAGFYYKVSGSGGAYTKVTCGAAPTSTTSFSYDLTGLTTGTTYTYYAWAVYNSGSEVTGTATETTFTPTQSGGGGGGSPTTYTSTLTSKSWASTGDFGWTSGKEGAGFSNNGIQVTSNALYTGANGTTNKTFTNVSSVVVTYNTNKSAGAGTLDLKVGTNAAHTGLEWAYSGSSDGRTANFTATFDLSASPESGAITLTANTTTNSIYIVSVTVTATAISN